MSALKEFANFITLNVANLAATYDRLLIENSVNYASLPTDSRIVRARRLIKSVVEAYESGTSDPLYHLFDDRASLASPEPGKSKLPQPLVEIECLGQTLTPVVTNLEAGKFLWQILSEARRNLLSMPNGYIPDITLPQHAEEQLHQAEAKYRLLIEQIPLVTHISALDDIGSTRYISPQIEAMVGYSPDEWLADPELWSKLLHPDDCERVLAANAHTNATGEPLSIEYRLLARDGRVVWIREETMVVKDEAGRPLLQQGIFLDITERKQVETILRLTQFTIDRAAVDVTWIGSDAQLLYVNDSTCRTLGYSREELLSMTVHDMQASPQSVEMWPEHFKELRQRGSFTFDTQHRRKNGQIFPVEITVNYIEFDGKEYNCAFMWDITERKQLEQQVQESLERRTHQVQTSTEVAQQISTITALDDLFQRLVNLVQTQFDYYHVQVYTLTEDDLVLQEGTGEAGRRMKEAGHKIALTAEKSLVVRAVWEGEPVLVSNVLQEPTWLPNPLLPDTKAELAVPILLGAEVQGVLDVQSDTTGGLNEEDQFLLKGLCGQIAIAIDNRRIESRRRQAEERLIEERNLLRAVIDNVPDLIQVKDAESRFLLVNAASMPHGNLTKLEDFVGKTDFDLSPPELAAQYYADEQAVMHSGQPVIGREELNVSPDGQHNWFSTTKAPLRDGQGNIIGIIGVSRNITGLKQTQIELEQLLIETERRARREQTIREITDRLRTAPTMKRLVEIATEELQQRLSATHTKLELGLEIERDNGAS